MNFSFGFLLLVLLAGCTESDFADQALEKYVSSNGLDKRLLTSQALEAWTIEQDLLDKFGLVQRGEFQVVSRSRQTSTQIEFCLDSSAIYFVKPDGSIIPGSQKRHQGFLAVKLVGPDWLIESLEISEQEC